MAAPNRKELEIQQDIDVQDELARSQEFKAIDANSAKFKDLLFFLQLSGYGISTVFIAFLLLDIKFSALGAFTMAMLISLVVRFAVQLLIKLLKKS